MNAFARHGIDHLSASSLNCWRAAPGLWTLRYLLRIKDPGSAAMWRGTAVEGGLEAILRGVRIVGEATQIALVNFDRNAQGEITDEIMAEREAIPAYIAALVAHINKSPRFPPLIATQLRVEHWLDGIPIPVIGYIDYVFEDGSVLDLKTTRAIPSSPKADHARQVAGYMKARETEAGSLLYVSPKRVEHYPVTEIDTHLAGMRRDALALSRFLDRFPTAVDAAKALPCDVDDFRWGEATRAKAVELWS